MKFIFFILSTLLFTFYAHSQTLAYADTVSTPVGDFMLETNEEPSSAITFDHQTQTSSDGGTAEQVNFFPSSERKTSVVAFENLSFNIKPNPTKDMANLSVKNGGMNLIVRISDISGRIISTQNYYSANGEYLNAIDISQYSPGIYFIELNTGGYHFSQKLVKQ